MDVQESTKRLLLRNRRSTAPKVILEFHVLLGLTLFRERLQLPVRCSIFRLHVLTVLCNPVHRHETMEGFLLVTRLNVGKVISDVKRFLTWALFCELLQVLLVCLSHVVLEA